MPAQFMENYEGSFKDSPSEKYPKGEVAGRLRLLRDKVTLLGDEDNGDEIQAGFLPANSIVVDAWARVNKSLGVTGILTLGHLASQNEDGGTLAKDPDGFVGSVDGGGQAAFARNDGNASVGVRLGSETQVIATVTEDLDGSVTDGVFDFCIFYVSD